MVKVKFAPLSGGYMASSMLGFVISVIYVRKVSVPWSLAFSLVFFTMFISSIISMTYADPDNFIEFEEKGKKKK